MNKTVSTEIVAEHVIVDGQEIVRLQVRNNDVKDLLLCLQLLLHRYVNGAILTARGSILKVKVGDETSFMIDQEETRQLSLELSMRDLEAIVHFFMVYYRDEVSAVDHVDLETKKGDYITFSVDNVAPVLDPSTVRRRLGL